jgi:hypothetical protein
MKIRDVKLAYLLDFICQIDCITVYYIEYYYKEKIVINISETKI